MYYSYKYFLFIFIMSLQKNRKPTVKVIAEIKDEIGYLIEIIEKTNRKSKNVILFNT